MRLRGVTHPLDWRRDELVCLQHGAMTRSQLIGRGLSDAAIAHQVRAGRWQQVHRGTYVLFTGPLPPSTRLWAALLRAGPTAVASHWTAAHLDGLADDAGTLLHVTVDPSSRPRGRIDGVQVHSAHRLAASRHPSRTPPRTRVEDTVLDLVDLAPTLGDVAGWVTRACQRRLTTPDRLALALASRAKIAWRPETEAMVVDVADGAASPLEVAFVRRVARAHGLPVGVLNERRSGRRVVWVDVSLRPYSTRIELDGRVGHVEMGAFRDRRRDNAATVAGEVTLRYGHVETLGDSCGVAAEIASVIGPRGWTGTLEACSPDCTALPRR